MLIVTSQQMSTAVPASRRAQLPFSVNFQTVQRIATVIPATAKNTVKKAGTEDI
jgi:hypothetical protein